MSTYYVKFRDTGPDTVVKVEADSPEVAIARVAEAVQPGHSVHVLTATTDSSIMPGK
jgi:hypothetical protein